jgi:CheY-like chemotaxis protein
MRDQYLPQLELGPALESRFDTLKRGFQDAVSSTDLEALEGTQQLKARFLDRLAASRGSMDPEASAKLRGLLENYYSVSYDVSRRMITEDAGESSLQAVQRMQLRSKELGDYLKQVTTFDRPKLMKAFSLAIEVHERAAFLRLIVSLVGILLVCAFSLWVATGTLQSLASLVSGLERFGMADFSVPIPVTSTDEFGRVTTRANEMADALRRAAEDRDRSDWVKAGVSRLEEILREDLAPKDVAARSLAFLVSRVGALAGAMYLSAGPEVLELAAHTGLRVHGSGDGFLPERAPSNEGLLGRAASEDGLLVIDHAPPTFLRIETSLGNSNAAVVVLASLRRGPATVGVVELAFFDQCSSERLELLSSSRELIAAALESAFDRERIRNVLEETRQLASRLTTQEERLRETNHELVAQQEELRVANEALETSRNALGQKNVELERARRTLEEKASELEKVSAYKSQFLANMSHELRTPLNSMLLLSHLLAKNEANNLTTKQVEYCKTVHGAGKDLLNLINQILDLAKIEAGRQEVYVEPVPIEEVVQQLERIFAPLAADRGLRFTIEVGSEVPPSIRTDRNRLERILTNLLGNAIKFTPRGGVALRVRVPSETVATTGGAGRAQGRLIAFAVSDTGIGIAPDAIDRVFAPFEQVEGRTDRRYGGSGLGLTISRESASLLGGELRATSTLGEGSVFTCLIPDNPSVDAGRIAERPKPSLGPRPVPIDDASADGARPHLLVIEDDAVIAEQLVDIIHARKLRVTVATTGEEGLRIARTDQPHGIILDVRLPDVDGWSVMDRLRHDPQTSDIPVHFISAVDTPERGFALGAVGYLTKPVTTLELMNVVRTLAPSSTRTASKVLVVEDSAAAARSIEALLAVEGVPTEHVSTAQGARDALKARRFDCMILDLGLPDMDGLGLLETLREEDVVERPPVIVYTARALTRDELRRLENYVQAVVLKDGNSEQRLLDELRLFVGRIKDEVPATRALASQPEVSLRGTKLLVVDDDMRTVYALSALLRGKGAEVIVGENGREGVALVRQHPDVQGVLMDIMMPEMDGYEAMKQIRKERRFSRLPLIALTAKAMKGERERCMEAGATDYVAKPIDADELLRTLSKWLTPEPAA